MTLIKFTYYRDRELDMEQFDRCRTVCQTYDQNLFRKDIVEGFVLAVSHA